MTYKEYRIQKALGSINYLIAARTTKSPKVLKDIAEIYMNPFNNLDDTKNNYIEALLAIVSNPNIYIETLQNVILSSWSTVVIETGIHNPKVTRTLLEMWIKVSYFLSSNNHVKNYLYNLQVMDNVPEKDRISIKEENINTPNYPYYPWPSPQPEQIEYKEWTSTNINDVEWLPSILPHVVTYS